MSSGNLWFTLETLKRAFRELGVSRAYFKWLAPNDNSKNQIYLGSDYAAINILPIGGAIGTSTGKGGRAVFKAPLKLEWLSPERALVLAPHAQVILYGQYPEIRLSGFLKGAREAPGALLSKRSEGRVLFLGVTGDGRVIAHAAAAYDQVVAELPRRVAGDRRVFHELPLSGGRTPQDSRTRLLAELRRVHEKGWINSKRLSASGTLQPCNSPQCGGYTLEAELGVRPNGFAKPDFEGWEVKQHAVKEFGRSSGPVTLITPEPDGGFYVEKGVEAFIRKYGYPDKLGRPDRINVGGVHRVGKRDPKTGLELKVEGFDTKTIKINAVDGGVLLLDRENRIAAKWSFSKLIGHWKRKHAKAAFIQSQLRTKPERQYRYGSEIELGEDSDLALFLRAMCAGEVYWDPALKIEGASSSNPRTKRRNQFRIKGSGVSVLYRAFVTVSVLNPHAS